jgi:3-deoxy-D-manno-octulosonate 8-phosphate phosphatase KdsC-like HAD superfamily phosphatase
MLDSIGSPSSILTLQEQKVFRNRHSNLDIIKYKNGKQNYISYVQAIDNKQKYK